MLDSCDLHFAGQAREDCLSKLDSTGKKDQSREATPPPPQKSAAASRILRAVEKSRLNAEATRSEHAASPAPLEDTAARVEAVRPIEQDPPSASMPQPEDLLRVLSETAPGTGKLSVFEPAANPTSAAVADLDDIPELPPVRTIKESKKAAAGPKVETAAQSGEVELRLSSAERRSGGSRFPIRVGAVVLLLLGGGGAAYKFGLIESAKPAASAGQSPEANRVFVPMSGVGGWSPNWGGDAAKTAGRSISMFRPSLQQVNYRIEFEGQIEQKGFGWIFRAKDPLNYYAYKIEVVKPGLEPLVALSRVTVADGRESQKHYTLFDKPVRSDTIFRVRMDARQDEFKTWVNDQLIGTWRDKRHASGGIGLFSDKGESAQIRKVQIYEMR